jgi:hypothetical protein
VSATEEPGENVWTVRHSRSQIAGANLGREAYPKLFEEARKEANKTGTPVTVRADATLSDSARATWRGLAERYPDLQLGDRPEVTFRPSVSATAQNTAPLIPEAQPQSSSLGSAVADIPSPLLDSLTERVMKALQLSDHTKSVIRKLGLKPDDIQAMLARSTPAAIEAKFGKK